MLNTWGFHWLNSWPPPQSQETVSISDEGELTATFESTDDVAISISESTELLFISEGSDSLTLSLDEQVDDTTVGLEGVVDISIDLHEFTDLEKGHHLYFSDEDATLSLDEFGYVYIFYNEESSDDTLLMDFIDKAATKVLTDQKFSSDTINLSSYDNTSTLVFDSGVKTDELTMHLHDFGYVEVFGTVKIVSTDDLVISLEGADGPDYSDIHIAVNDEVSLTLHENSWMEVTGTIPVLGTDVINTSIYDYSDVAPCLGGQDALSLSVGEVIDNEITGTLEKQGVDSLTVNLSRTLEVFKEVQAYDPTVIYLTEGSDTHIFGTVVQQAHDDMYVRTSESAALISEIISADSTTLSLVEKSATFVTGLVEKFGADVMIVELTEGQFTASGVESSDILDISLTETSADTVTYEEITVSSADYTDISVVEGTLVRSFDKIVGKIRFDSSRSIGIISTGTQTPGNKTGSSGSSSPYVTTRSG